MSPAEVRTARKSLGLTQAELGALFEVAQNAVSMWERDPPVPGRGIPTGTAIALRYMVQFGLPDVALTPPSGARS